MTDDSNRKEWIAIIALICVIVVIGVAYQFVSADVEAADIGELKFVSKTEYVYDDEGQVIVELLNNQLSQISGVDCVSSVWYPDKREFIVDELMIESPLKSGFSTQTENMLICAPLDNTLVDYHVPQYNLTSNGSGFVSGGMFGGYYSLNGVDQVMQFPGQANPGTLTVFTYGFDMRMSGPGTVISNSDGGTGFDLSIAPSGTSWSHRVRYSGWVHNGGSAIITNVTDGQWHRIVYQLDRSGNWFRVWVDGVMEVQASMGTSFGNPVQGWANLNALPTTFGYSAMDVAFTAVDVSNAMYWNKRVLDAEVNEMWNFGYGSTCEAIIDDGFALGPPLGTYGISFVVPEEEGVYEYSSTCEVNNKNITKSSSFHVSSGFRRILEDLDTIVTIVDMGMDEQRYPKEVKAEWMLRADELNITGASCWVEASTPDSLSDSAMFVLTDVDYHQMCTSFTGQFRNNTVYGAAPNGFYWVQLYNDTGLIQNITYDVLSLNFTWSEEMTFWLDSGIYYSTTSTVGGIYNVYFTDVTEGRVLSSQEGLSTGFGSMCGNKHMVNLPIDVSFLEASHVYEMRFEWVSGEVFIGLNADGMADSDANFNPYDLDVVSGAFDGTGGAFAFSGSCSPYPAVITPIGVSVIPQMAIFGSADYVPGVYVDIDNDAQSVRAEWDPKVRESLYEGYVYNNVKLVDPGSSGGYPTCSYPVGLLSYDNSAVEQFFYPEASFSTVCDVTYFIHDTEFVKRLTKETFLSHKGLRAFVVK